MAQSFASSFGTIVNPGVYSSLVVATNASGLGLTGVVTIMGEADGGPSYAEESDLTLNVYGPSQYSQVQAKYLSGNLVDAFRNAVQASNDASITGSPAAIVVVKTNTSGRATAALVDPASAAYATMRDANYGALGNLLYFNVTEATAEVVPTTGPFTWIPNDATLNGQIRVNGGAINAVTALAINTTPAQLVTAVNALSAGVTATGGALRTVLPGASGTVTLTNVSNSLTIGYSGTFTTAPVIGDTLQITSTSALATATSNSSLAGSYVVTAGSTNSITATKLSDAGSGGGTPGMVTPVSITTTPVSIGATTDIKVWSPVTFANTTTTLFNGWGKSLEVIELTTGTDKLSNCLFNLSTTKVTWLSGTGAPQLLTSSAEEAVTTNINRQVTNTSVTFTVGGELGLTLGYTGTTGTVTISATTLTTTVTGGSGVSQSLTLANFPTIADLVAYLNAQTGYTAAVGTVALGQLSPAALDEVTTVGICTTFGAMPGRVKTDAYRYNAAVTATNVVTLSVVPTAGLPKVTATTFLSGGSKGGTTNSTVAAALVALQGVSLNFLIPLFSQNASLDVTAGLTTSASTYTIDSINAAVRSHVLLMSQFLSRKWRQGFLSYRDTFLNARAAAANMANYRLSMCFQDVKVQNSQGTITQYQPWMAATLAAGMQAAGFYRPIVKKFVNCSGIVSPFGDYNDNNDGQKTTALLSGLLPLEKAPSGGIRWTSDQTTYGQDNNFSFNSIVTTYLNDVQQYTISQQMEARFIGQSSANVSEGIMLSYLDGIMLNLLQLKVISPSDDAPQGFRNASVDFTGNAFVVNVETKTSTAVYFGVLNILVTQIQQSASSANA